MKRVVLLFVLSVGCFRNDGARTILASPTARFPVTWQERDASAQQLPPIVRNVLDVTAAVERTEPFGTKTFDEDDVRIRLEPADIRDSSPGCPSIHRAVVMHEVSAALRMLDFELATTDVKNKKMLDVMPIADVRSCRDGRVGWQLALEVRHNGQLLAKAYAGPASSLRGDIAAAALSAVRVMHRDENLRAFVRGEEVPTLYVEEQGPEPIHQLDAPLSMLVLPLKPSGGVSEDTCALLTSYMLGTLDHVRALRSVSKDDIETTLTADKQRQALGCDALACMVEIGGALGVDVVAYGQVGMIGSRYNVNLSVVRSSDAHVVARASTVVADSYALAASVPMLVNQIVDRLNVR